MTDRALVEPKSRTRSQSAAPRRDPESGTWGFVVDAGIDPGTGKRRQVRRRGFATRKAAEQELARVRHGVQNSDYVAPDRLTVSSFLTNEWLPATKSTIESTTFESYERNLRLHVIPSLGEMRLQRLEPQRLNALYATLLANGRRDGKGGLSARTVRYLHTIIHRALKDATRWGKVSRNVADLADPPSQKAARPPEMKIWDPQQLRAFLDYVEQQRDLLAPAFRLAGLAGMRRGEVLGLTWADIDFDHGALTVRRQLRCIGRKIEHVEITKTASGRRRINLDSGTLAALRTARARQAAERLAMGTGYQESAFVFTQPDGAPIHPMTMTETFSRRIKSAKLPKIRLHDLRHSHVAHLIAAGTHVKVISERVGHASTSFTMDRYGHLMDGQQSDAADAVALLVDGGHT